MGSREDNIYYARLAEQGERYEDMIFYMKQVATVSTLPVVSKAAHRLFCDAVGAPAEQ
jgi:hypothetical protein